ncbi:hypothetical protein PCANC_12600 [Puccinia coronata f. sp. avenae]|uniref:Uncharacterized protein n=1 Tax=Puccinia coronata f. sp. avenae TaxID=200324 RepID=A0A2N5UMY3_9BASI|nr:hypothetical protein PCANC_12600 [Puccinia coronata f. sp. avenae]
MGPSSPSSRKCLVRSVSRIEPAGHEQTSELAQSVWMIEPGECDQTSDQVRWVIHSGYKQPENRHRRAAAPVKTPLIAGSGLPQVIAIQTRSGPTELHQFPLHPPTQIHNLHKTPQMVTQSHKFHRASQLPPRETRIQKRYRLKKRQEAKEQIESLLEENVRRATQGTTQMDEDDSPELAEDYSAHIHGYNGLTY